VRSDLREAAALWQANAALREAEFGERREALDDINAALALADGRNIRVFAALTFARLGDTRKAEAFAADLQRDFPNNTVLMAYRMPSIRAAIALSARDPRRALQLLESARPYELGQPTPTGLAPLYPVYLRGEAYLSLHDGRSAATEFQKVLDHPGIALTSALGPLSQLGVARAAAVSADIVAARRAYRDFLVLWKNADPGLALLSSARAELATLPGPADSRTLARAN
jgi:hypothetical protein